MITSGCNETFLFNDSFKKNYAEDRDIRYCTETAAHYVEKN